MHGVPVQAVAAARGAGVEADDPAVPRSEYLALEAVARPGDHLGCDVGGVGLAEQDSGLLAGCGFRHARGHSGAGRGGSEHKGPAAKAS